MYEGWYMHVFHDFAFSLILYYFFFYLGIILFYFLSSCFHKISRIISETFGNIVPKVINYRSPRLKNEMLFKITIWLKFNNDLCNFLFYLEVGRIPPCNHFFLLN